MSEITIREYLEKLIDARLKHLEDRIEALERMTNARFSWLDKTTASLALGMEKRLDGMNEFRDTIKDLKGEFPNRNEIKAEIKPLEADIRALQKYQAGLEGSQQQIAGKASNLQVTVAILLGAIGTITGIVGAGLQMFGKITP